LGRSARRATLSSEPLKRRLATSLPVNRQGQAARCRIKQTAALAHYTGLVEQTDTFTEAAAANRPTAWDDQYMRLFMHFDAGAPRYRWLNTSLFVARGRLVGTGNIEYECFRIT
jgi:hypothetical protein